MEAKEEKRASYQHPRSHSSGLGGKPVSLKKVAKGWGNTLGCILRETVQITCPDLKLKDAAPQRDALLRKLNDKYTFPVANKARAKHGAIKKFNKMLNNWWCKARKEHVESDFKTVVKPKWSNLEPRGWASFLEWTNIDDFKNKSHKFKELRTKLQGNHNLSNGGYLGKQPKWDKEDEEFIAAGKPVPLSEHQVHPRDHHFIRARAR